MTEINALSLAKAKALHKTAISGKTVREPEGDWGSAIGTSEDLLIVVFAPTAEGAEAGRDAVLAALAFASESVPIAHKSQGEGWEEVLQYSAIEGSSYAKLGGAQ